MVSCLRGCMSGANPRTLADLFVPETVQRAVEPEDIQALRLRTGGAAADHDAIARFERARCDTDRGKLPAVIHLETPPLLLTGGILDVDQEERVRIDQLKLRDNAFDCRT